ncbi:MAG: hypothetical protein M3T56_11045 [Chloroflexota bacterium]|nr:hypothetical protein [Chloroflexota bacterium]
MKVVHGEDSRGPIASSTIVIGALAVLAFTVVGGNSVQTVAPITAVIVIAAIAYRTVLAWRSLLALIILVILFIPIKRYSLPASLPFNLEPYRLLVAFVAAGWLTSLLIDRRVRLRRSGLEGPLGLYAVAILSSLLANSHRVGTLSGEVQKKLAFFASFFILFYLIVSVARRARDIEFIVQVLAGGGAVLAFFAVIESRTGYNIFDHLSSAIPFLHLNGLAVPVIDDRGGRLRVFASAQHAIALGAVFVILLPLAIYRARSRGLWQWWIAVMLLVLGALATSSRTAVVMLGVEGLVFLLLRPVEMKRLWLALIPALLVIHFAIPGALGTVRGSFFPRGGLISEQQSPRVGSGRLATLGPVLHSEYYKNPLVGEGFGTRITKATDLVPVPNGPILDDEWLGILVETGLIGALSLVWMFIRIIRRLGSEAKRDLSSRGGLLVSLTAGIAAFAVSMFLYDAFAFIQIAFMLFIFLGLGVCTYLAPAAEWAVEEKLVPRAKRFRPVPA